MKDALERKVYAAKISDEISEHYQAQKEGKESESIVFAISGKWGEGKTALLDLLEPNLIKKGFTVVRFNPWQYSQEDVSLKRSFLRIVKEKLEVDVSLEDLYFDKSKTVIDWKPILKVVPKTLLLGGFLLYILVPLVIGGYSLPEWWTLINNALVVFWGSGVGGVVFSALVIPLLIQTVVVSSRKAQITTAEEFDTKFKELLKSKTKIAIFVDDLDRCTSATAKIVLDSLRTFFHHPECSYVITGDHTVIERYAAEELNPKKETLTGKDREEGRRFLKKLFDVYWRLPLATPKVFKRFITEEVQKADINLTEAQSKNISIFLLDDRLFERNPRHAKRFITALKFALQSVNLQAQELNQSGDSSGDDQNDIKEEKISIKEILNNIDLLAKVLLIQEKFYPIYEKLVLYPAEIVSHEKSLRAGNAPDTLLIEGEGVLSVILEGDVETLKNYASLVILDPQFTNADNAVIFDPTNFFSSSVATGLPSLKGPDESNFPHFLKSGQLADRLGANLEAAPQEKRNRFAQRALLVADESVETEKYSVIREGLKMSTRLDEWAAQLPQWGERLFALPADQQNSLADDWWKALLIKAPSMLAEIKAKQPAYFPSIWPVLESMDQSLLHKDTLPDLENILVTEISLRPPVLKGAEIYLQKFEGATLLKIIQDQLVDPAACKVFLDSLEKDQLGGGKVATIVRKRLLALISEFTYIDWITANKDYLKSLELFESSKRNLTIWAKDLQQFNKIAELKDSFELSEEEKKTIGTEVIVLVRKSANLEFLSNPNTQFFLNKERKVLCFEQLKDIFGNSTESVEKRKQASELLLRSNTLWTGIESDDIYETLKTIKGFKWGRNSEQKLKAKEILDSWGFNDSTLKENS